MSYDDDLFEYDPDLDQVQSTVTPSVSNETVTPLSKTEKEFFDSIKNNADDDIESSGNIIGTSLSFAQSFQSTVTAFINTNTQNAAYVKSTIEVLDEITEGRFSLLQYKANLELVISRSMHVLYLTSFLTSDEPFSDSESSIKEVLNLLNLDFNKLYLKTCFHSTLAILQHKLVIDREIYKSTCSHLGVVPHPSLFLEPSEYILSDQSFELKDFIDNIYSNITDHIYESTNLLQSISDLLGKNVTF